MTRSEQRYRREAVLEGLAQSGLTMAAYCQQHGLSYGTVAHWRRAIRRPGEPPAARSAMVRPMDARVSRSGCGEKRGAARFVELEAVGPVMGGELARLCAEVSLPGGVVVRLFSPVREGGVS